MNDFRYAFRALRKNPGFSSVAILTLAIGIGANCAVFSVIQAVLLKPLPYAEPQELALVWTEFGRDLPQNWVSGPELMEMRALNSTLEGVEALAAFQANITGDGEPEQVDLGLCTGGLFELLRIQPEAGRVLQPSDDVAGSAPSVMLSYGFWERRYGKDPSMVGNKIVMDGVPASVVGILPKDFKIHHPDTQFPADIGVWTSFSPLLPTVFGTGEYQSLPRGAHFMSVVARLKPGLTLSQAQADLDAVAVRMKEKSPQYYDFEGWGLKAVGMQADLVEDVRTVLLVLMGAVGFVLLIACVNVANLLLSRAAAREREVAIRTALGISRKRLLRQLLSESLCLSILGGVGGVVLGYGLVAVLGNFAPARLPRVGETSIDATVLAFTLVVALMTGLLFGLAPVVHSWRQNLVESLKEGGRGTSAGLRSRIFRSGLVVAEVAAAMVLLVGAVLMLQSYSRLTATDPGFRSDSQLTARVSLPRSKYSQPEAMIRFSNAVLERIESLPGVDSVGLISQLPLSGDNSSGTTMVKDSQTVPAEQRAGEIDRRQVSTDYFSAMGIRLVKGRFFSRADREDAPLVAIVDTEFVKRFWPTEDPIGQFVSIGGQNGPVWREVVGVVEHSRHHSLDRVGRAQVYFPYAQVQNPNFYLAIRSSGDPLGQVDAVRKAVWEVDPDQPVADIQTMSQRVDDALSQPRFSLLLLLGFGMVALLLASIGLYGVISYSVSLRQPEIGVRMALGADAGAVRSMVLSQGLRLIGMGVALGIAAALALGSVLRSVLFEIPARDPLTIALVGVVLAAAGILACWIPSRRASRVDPLKVLRGE